MSEAIRLTLLGRIDLRRTDGREVRSVLAQPKRVALLAFLSVEGRFGAVSRDRVIGTFWPDTTGKRARSSLRTALYKLRQSLGAHAVETHGTDVRLDPAAVWCDAARLLEASAEDDHAAVLRLHGGDFMVGFHLSDAVDFDRWLEGRRAEVHRAVVSAVTTEAIRDPTDPEVTRVLAKLVERRPGEEEAVLLHLEGVHRSRGAGAARAVHDTWTERYRELFEREPGSAATDLLDRLDAGGERRATPAERAPVSLAARLRAPPVTADPFTPPAAPRRTVPPPVGVLAVVVVVAAAIALLRGGPAAREPDDTTGIAVASFDVQGPAREGHLGRLAGFLLGRELGGPGPPPVWPAGAGSTPDGCSPSSAEAGARISGEVRVEGETVRIRACLLRVGIVDRTWEVQGSLPGFYEAVATLAREVRADLALPRPDEAAPPPTSAPGAYSAFVEGDRHRVAGRFRDAVAAYDRALALDPTFAWAHYRRSASAEWLGLAGQAKESADHALTHSARLTARERTLLDAWRSYLWGDVEQARTAYASLAHDRPADPDVWGRLGELRFHWGSRLGIPNDSADAAFRRVLDLTPDHAPALLHHIRFAGRTAGLAELEALAARVSALDVPESELLEVATIVALRGGDETFLPERGVPWVLATDSVGESARLGGLLATTAAPAAVERLIELLPPEGDETRQVLRRILLVHTAAMRGRLGLARERIDDLGRTHPDRAVELTAFLALLPIVPDDQVGFERALAGIRTVAPPPVPVGSRVKYAPFEGIFPLRHVFLDAALASRLPAPLESARYQTTLSSSNDLFKADYRRLVDGVLWRWRGEPERVLNALREGWLPADRVFSDMLDYPTAVERWLRIEALMELGRGEDALRWLRTFPDASGYDVAWLPAAWVIEAELLERRGLAEEASGRFRQALSLWHDADPEIEPWLARARDGLERTGG